MKKIMNYLELMGYVEDRPASKSYLCYKHPESGDMFWITYTGREYKAEHMKVFTNNAISVSKYTATTIPKVLEWIEKQ